ncbi:MAG: amidohydrolase, partial [Mariprofundus sp.]
MKQTYCEQINAEQLAKAVDAVMPEMINKRRSLHMQPELSGQEENTANMIADYCRQLRLDVREGIGGYGVLACLNINTDKPWLAFRPDMDALPIA